MDRQGKHLSGAERAVIFSEDLRGSSQRRIARLLGRAASTIGRELERGTGKFGASSGQVRGRAGLVPAAGSARL